MAITFTLLYDNNNVNVIAMKYVEGSHLYIPDDADDWEERLDKIGASRAFGACDIYDVHEGNFVLTRNGEKVIIDLGE